MEINDWVNSYSQGYWKIYRIIKMKSVFPEPDERTLVFSKRLINDKLKRSFSVECCHSSFIRPLSEIQKSNLENYLTENPDILSKFDKYERSIDSILN